jgi:hypothetical protein
VRVVQLLGGDLGIVERHLQGKLTVFWFSSWTIYYQLPTTVFSFLPLRDVNNLSPKKPRWWTSVFNSYSDTGIKTRWRKTTCQRNLLNVSTSLL